MFQQHQRSSRTLGSKSLREHESALEVAAPRMFEKLEEYGALQQERQTKAGEKLEARETELAVRLLLEV